MRFKPLVGASDQCSDVTCRLVEYQHGVNVIGSDGGAFADFGKRVQDGLYVFRIDVQPFRRDDHGLLASAEIQAAFSVDFTDVAGMKPAAIARRHTFAPDEDFSIRGNPYILTFDHFSDGACACVEWMIYRDDEARLGQTVPLDDSESALLPEFFQLRVDASASHDKSPELPAESPMSFSKTPHANRKPSLSFVAPFGRFALDLMLQVLENSRNAHQRGDPVFADEMDDSAGMDFAREDDASAEEQRDEQSLRLPEHVAERQQIQNPNRLEGLRPPFVFRDFLLKGSQIGTDVAMSVNDTFRLASRARGVHNHHHVVGRNSRRGKRMNGRPGGDLAECRVIEAQSWFGLASDPLDELGRKPKIDRHDFHTSRDACPERGYPFQPVFRPKQDAVTLLNAVAVEVLDHSADLSVQIAIRGDPRAETIRPAERLAAAKSFDLGDQFEKSLHTEMTVLSIFYT